MTADRQSRPPRVIRSAAPVLEIPPPDARDGDRGAPEHARRCRPRPGGVPRATGAALRVLAGAAEVTELQHFDAIYGPGRILGADEALFVVESPILAVPVDTP